MAEAEAAADVEEALDEAHARRACEAGGASGYPASAAGTEAADGAGAGDAEEARRNEKLLRIVLQLVNSGYLSKANALRSQP